MKTTPSHESKPETPKTPGGISKSLLTPCRRVGLSRNWRKSTVSPFQSPLSSTEKQVNVDTRKRKETCEETVQKEDTGTPSRKVDLPHRKKSKALLCSINQNDEDDSSQLSPRTEKAEGPKPNAMEVNEFQSKEVSTPVRLKSVNTKSNVAKGIDDKDKNTIDFSSPFRLKSKSKSKKITPKCISNVPDNQDTMNDRFHHLDEKNTEMPVKTNENKTENENLKGTNNRKQKEISPNKLTKECIVVIQKKIFKNELEQRENKTIPVSQTLFEDSDDIPLKCLNKVESEKKNDVDDFISGKQELKKANSKTNDKPNIKNSSQINKTVSKVQNPSQSSLDDDDFFEKKTILIRKTYNKVIKPAKAKSTGSITQKDIEGLKARIEAKKKKFLAKSMTDTKELRELIKKWQRGCQDALMELMDLMKSKCPDNQNMDYSKILKSLNIPTTLVGYDSDNDCFVTPEDENILLSHVKDC